MLFDEFVANFGGAFLVDDSKVVPFLEFDVCKGDYGAHNDGGEKSSWFHRVVGLVVSGRNLAIIFEDCKGCGDKKSAKPPGGATSLCDID